MTWTDLVLRLRYKGRLRLLMRLVWSRRRIVNRLRMTTRGGRRNWDGWRIHGYLHNLLPIVSCMWRMNMLLMLLRGCYGL